MSPAPLRHPTTRAAPIVATTRPAALTPDLDALGEQIAELAAHLHAATYRLLCLIREFDEREGWATGFRSCAHVLSWRTGFERSPPLT